ncbi:MAG: DUF5683 domain-containing protein [Candidatus Zixiibacteriota bacterium]
MITKVFLFLVIMFFVTAICSADTTNTDSIIIYDTTLFVDEGLLVQTVPVTNPINLEKRLYQNPTMALFKSMLVPGWGQFGNRKYVKAGILLAFDIWFISSAVNNGQKASDFRDQYQNAVEISDRNELYGKFLEYKDQRNKFTWYAVITSFVSMFDAYVDAHLSGYPKQERGDKISMDIIPSGEDGIQTRVILKF